MKKPAKKLTIAIVSDAIYPYNKGGKEKRIYEVSTRLVKNGHDVHIYTMKWWKGKNSKKENGVYLHAISKKYPLYSGKRRSIKQAVMFAIACFKLIKEDFDFIDVDHMPHLILFPLKIVTLLKRKKLYVTWNEVWGKEYWVEYMGILGNIAYIIERFSVLMPDAIIAVSNHTKNKLITQLGVTEKIYVVPNGIDTQEIKNIKPSKVKSDVMYAGRLLNHKNVDVLIQAISKVKTTHPKVKCIIVGNGPEEKYLKKLTKQLFVENNVEFINFLQDHSELYSLMKSSKLFAFPSTREGFGIAVLEANTAGIPVITTNHKDNATKDLVQEGKNGYVVSPNAAEFAKKMVNYLKKNTAHNYAKYTKPYDWNVIAQNLMEVYLQ